MNVLQKIAQDSRTSKERCTWLCLPVRGLTIHNYLRGLDVFPEDFPKPLLSIAVASLQARYCGRRRYVDM
jgi:hypothetical protein